MNTSTSSTDSAVPTTAETSADSSPKEDPSVALSEGLLKLNWLNGLADLRRAQQANHDLLAAQLQQQFGKPVLQPGEDMIAVESPITNHTHFHTQAPPTGVGIPTWLKTALVVVGLSGAAGLGSVLTAPQKPPGALLEAQSQTQPPAQTQNPTPRDRKYELDFWDPLELPRQ